MQMPGSVGRVEPGSSGPCSYRHGGSGSVGPKRTPGGGWCHPPGWFRPRRDVVDAAGAVVGGVGWRSADHQAGGPAANPPHGRPDDGPGTTTPDSPGRSGRHGASGADDGPHTSPAAGHSQGTHSRRRGRPGRSVGRAGRPGWSARPPTAGSEPHPGPEATGPARPAAAPPALSLRVARGPPVGHRRSGGGGLPIVDRRSGRAWAGGHRGWGRGWSGCDHSDGG
jgi:hypothetical protein